MVLAGLCVHLFTPTDSIPLMSPILVGQLWGLDSHFKTISFRESTENEGENRYPKDFQRMLVVV